MTSPDYSARDKAVRHNVYASVRRRDGLSAELFTTYWRDVHATLCSRLPGLGFYVQQHFDRQAGANLWPIADGVRSMAAVLDGSAELGFASEAEQAIFAEASAILYADEMNLFGESVAYNLPHGSITFVDREEDGTRNGPDLFHRIHVYMSLKPGGGAGDWLTDSSAALAADPSVVKWKLHLPEPYDNDRPAPPAPNVAHIVDVDRLNIAVAEIAFVHARAARTCFAGNRFQSAFAQQSRHIAAMGAYRVSGFYTFVRNGKPTAAGIRGSRTAELIDLVGAPNQLAPEVEGHFVRA
jgi:hypothetical protein